MFAPKLPNQTKASTPPPKTRAARRGVAVVHRDPGEELRVDRAEAGGRAPAAVRSMAWDFGKIAIVASGSARLPPTGVGVPPLPRGIRPKLAVGKVDDPLEHEADRIADQVLAMPAAPQPVTPATLQVGRKCAGCEEEQTVRTKPAGPAATSAGEAPPLVQDVLRSSGQPLDRATRSFFEPRFGHDFSTVRIHTTPRAAESAQHIGALAYTVGSQVVFGAGQFAPQTSAGRSLLAHELVHVVQQHSGAAAVQRRAANCPATPPPGPILITLADFIALVQRVEASSATGSDPIATARLISRTKYDGSAWDWLLPTTKGAPGAVAGGTVTADDITKLCFKLIATLPGGGMEDPMHIIAAIVGDAETLPAGTGASGLVKWLVGPLPTSVTQRGVSTWVGDVGKAAAQWMAVLPLKGGGSTKDDYMKDEAAPHDLMGDVDGVAITSKTPASGFAFDKTKPLSDNLRRFFAPAKGTGRERRFHIFCNAEALALEKDGVTLSAAAKASIGKQVHDFSDWYGKNDPTILKYLTLVGKSFVIDQALIDRAGDWQWFADQFIDFMQKNLTAEGP